MIDGGINIHPLFPLWAVSLIGLLLFSFLIWKESKRKVKLLAWRLVAGTFLVLSIVGLVLQPSLQRVTNSRAILLTPHYEKETVDSLLKADDKLLVLRIPEALSYNAAEIISTNAKFDKFNIEFILGDGLPYYTLEQFKEHRYLKGELPTGIVELLTSQIFKVNQSNHISGWLRTNRKAKIKLISPAGVEDSVEYSTSGLYPFKLSFTPQQAGLFVYTIEVQDGNEVVSQKFPVEVERIWKLNILFIQNYPTAETKYLKNFLLEQGHGIVSRFQLSKNNFRYEYANHQQLLISRLSLDLLNSFDLVVIDNETLASFNKADKEILEESVRNELGIVQFFNSVNRESKPSFLSIPLIDFAKDTVQLQLGSSSITLPALPATVNGDYASILQTTERTLSGFIDRDLGKIGFQFLQETYRLVLQGKQDEYAMIWAPLIERTARSENQSSKIQLKNTFPIYPDEPIDLNVIATKENVRLQANGISIPLREDVVIDNYFHGKTWAGEQGWHRFAIAEDSVYKNYYVSDRHEWESLRIAQQQRVNELISKSGSSKLTQTSISSRQEPVSLLFFFLIFLIASGFLWLAPKI